MKNDVVLNQNSKLDPNPLVYLIDGVKRLVHTNLKTVLLVLALNIGLIMVIPAIFISVALKYDNALDLYNAVKVNIPFLTLLLLAFGITGYVSKLALDRVMISSVRGESITPGQSVIFGVHRFLPALIINAVIALIILIPTALIIFGMIVVNPWMGLLFLPVLVAFALLSFLATPIQFILVDNAPVTNVMSVFRRLFRLWKHGFVALLVYVLCMGFVSGGLGSFPGGTLPTNSNGESNVSSSMPNTFDSDIRNSTLFSDSTLRKIKFDFPQWIILPMSVIFLLVATFSLALRTTLETGLAKLYVTIVEKIDRAPHVT